MQPESQAASGQAVKQAGNAAGCAVFWPASQAASKATSKQKNNLVS